MGDGVFSSILSRDVKAVAEGGLDGVVFHFSFKNRVSQLDSISYC